MQRTSKLKVNLYTICAILAGLMLFGVLGTMDAEDEQAQLEHYCGMVKLHKQDQFYWWRVSTKTTKIFRRKEI